jgi:hypothetical protein
MLASQLKLPDKVVHEPSSNRSGARAVATVHGRGHAPRVRASRLTDDVTID